MALLCPNPECRFLRRHGVAASYRAGMTTCADCGAALVERVEGCGSTTAAVPSALAFAGQPRASALPLVITAACVAGMLALDLVLLPYLDGEMVRQWLGPTAYVPLLGELSLGALGVAPWITAALLVEIAAAVVPRWRPLREPGGRARLVATTDRLGVVVAGAQAMLLVPWLEYLQLNGAPLLVEQGMGVRVVLVLSMVAGGVLVRLLARVIDGRGVGGGMTLLVAAPLVIELGRWLHATVAVAREGGLVPGATFGAVVIVGGAVAATLLVRPFDDHERPPLPVAGMVPVVWGAAALQAGWSLLPSFNILPPGDTVHHLFLGACGIVLTVGVGRVLHLRALGFGRSVPLSVAFVVALVALLWLSGALDLYVPVLSVVVVACVARDLALEVAFRRSSGAVAVAGAVPSLARAHEVVTRLGSAGINAHVRATHHRALWHFFGPHLALDVLVPVSDLEQARSLMMGSVPA